jgi:hypothetical protein
MTLTANELEFPTYEQAQESYFERGWTDGLPIVPPTPAAVEQMLAAAALTPDTILGAVPTRQVVVSAEAVAINAVMAGCRPAYFPVVVAAVRAHLQKQGNCHSTTATVSGAAQVVIVNGPVRDAIDVHSGLGCFGPGFRANATIGRALRLVVRNVCLAVPGGVGLDRATYSTPLRYSFCFGENEEASDWRPLHVQRGFAAQDSVVTVCSLMSLMRASSYDTEPESILASVVEAARREGVHEDEFLREGRGMMLVIGPEHQRRFLDRGWTKERIQDHVWPELVADTRSRYDNVVALPDPSGLLIVAAGGPGMAESWLIVPHLSNPISEVVAPAVASASGAA